MASKPKRPKQLGLGLELEPAPEASARFHPHRRRNPWVFTVFGDKPPEPAAQLRLLPRR